MKTYKVITSFIMILCLSISLYAQDENQSETKTESAEAIADKLNNPTAAIGSLNGFIDFKTFDGDLPMAADQTAWSFTFQPSLPKPLKNGKNLMFRPAIPIILKQPVPTGLTYENYGVELGDISFDLAIGSTSDKGILFLAGIVGSMPTATNESIRGQWAFGPEIMVGKLTKKYIIGTLLSQKWDIESGPEKTSVLGGQYFMFFPIGKGRSIGAAPNYSYNWITKQFTFPVGIGYSSVTKFGKTPFKYGIQVHYYVAKDELFAPQWQFRLQLSPVVKLPWK